MTGNGFLGPNEIKQLSDKDSTKDSGSFVNFSLQNITCVYYKELGFSRKEHKAWPSPKVEKVFRDKGLKAFYYWVENRGLLFNAKRFTIFDYIKGSSFKYIINSSKEKNNFLDVLVFSTNENWTNQKIWIDKCAASGPKLEKINNFDLSRKNLLGDQMTRSGICGQGGLG